MLYKTLLNVMRFLKLDDQEVQTILGIDAEAFDAMTQRKQINPDTREGKQILLLIRLYVNIYALNGGNLHCMQKFFDSPSTLTQGIPRQQIQTPEGFKTALKKLSSINRRSFEKKGFAFYSINKNKN
jgi:hypothetical protein